MGSTMCNDRAPRLSRRTILWSARVILPRRDDSGPALMHCNDGDGLPRESAPLALLRVPRGTSLSGRAGQAAEPPLGTA